MGGKTNDGGRSEAVLFRQAQPIGIVVWASTAIEDAGAHHQACQGVRDHRTPPPQAATFNNNTNTGTCTTPTTRLLPRILGVSHHLGAQSWSIAFGSSIYWK
jgi:hypothetical protein